MKTRQSSAAKWLSVGALFVTTVLCRATIPEPDNVIYGNITLDNVLVTGARTDVVVEARRTTNGPAIASYRMGADPAIGNFYALRLLLESAPPISNTNASQVSQSVIIVVTDVSGLRAQAPFTITDRGVAQRIDFGAAAADSDGDGLPDAWELQRYANLNQSMGSVAPNGLTALQNFVAGTDPNADGFRLQILATSGQKHVSFRALRAEGPGYEGMTRRYSLESRTTPIGGNWTGLTNFTDIPGNNQVVDYVTSGPGASAFFRGSISLQGFVIPGADGDADGLPDAWETLHFGNLSQNANSPTANGQTAIHNYVADTDPNAAGSNFKVNVTQVGAQRQVSFNARRAEGPGYENKQRYYALESSSNPAGPWVGVAGYTNVLGDNQLVTFQSGSGASALYYRGKTWLQP
jgi:hypothetical protein